MSKSKNKEPVNKSLEKPATPQINSRTPLWKQTRFIITAVVIAAILIIVGIFYYQERVAPFSRTIISVNDNTVNMDYFLKRTRLAGATPINMLKVLSREQILKLAAPEYVGEVSPEDIDGALRSTSNTTSESEFRAWYRQTLNENGLTDAEYREIVEVTLLKARFHVYLAERVSPVDEQVHLHAILVETDEEAEAVRARWEDGEDFADLAREVTLDEEYRDEGGDIGWFPRGILDYYIEDTAFKLNMGDMSDPVPYYFDDPMTNPEAKPFYYLLMVSEKADTRELDDNALKVRRYNALEDWFTANSASYEIDYTFNSEINAWMNWQLARQ